MFRQVRTRNLQSFPLMSLPGEAFDKSAETELWASILVSHEHH